MKAKLGIILLVFCAASFFIYKERDPRARKTQVEKLINGKVIDKNSEQPIDGVVVVIDGKQRTLSNLNGEFTIMTKEGQDVVLKHSKYKSLMIPATDLKLVKMEIADPAYVKDVMNKLDSIQ